MDPNKINDIDKLKSLAYDQLMMLEQVQQNIRLINERIKKLAAETSLEQSVKSKKAN